MMKQQGGVKNDVPSNTPGSKKKKNVNFGKIQGT